MDREERAREKEKDGGERGRVKRRAACLPVITRRNKVIPGHK